MSIRTTGFSRATTALATFMLMFAGMASAADLGVGDAAADFRLQDQNGAWHTLADYKGEWVALYFYPKDDTPGCTTEACEFRDDIFKFKKMGVKLIGVSLDDVASHKEFADKYHLPFTLLSDADAKLADAYGVVKSYLGVKIASRETFLINPDGDIVRHYAKVKPATHSAEVLTDLAALIPAPAH